MQLLSAGSSVASGAAAHLHHATKDRLVRHVTKPAVSYTAEMSSDMAPVTATQTVSIGATVTNFTNQPLSPDLNLFDPSLGTLVSVAVSHTATIVSNVTSQNLSPTSSTVITANSSGSYVINGLNEPISQPTRTLTSEPMPAGPFGSGTDTVTFPPLELTDSSTTTFTDPSSLAFFTSSSGRSAVTVTMSATASAAASAPNGNLLTTTASTASSTVTVTYTYVPVCPTVAAIGRIGVHHQRTKIVVTFSGPVDATKAEDPANYSVIEAGGKTIPIISATYDPTTNSVTLIPAERLNVHHHFRLSLVLPCPNMQTGETVIIPFGGKESLIGFHNHRGEFVTVKDARIDGFYDWRGQYIPIHDRRVDLKGLTRLKGPATESDRNVARKPSIRIPDHSVDSDVTSMGPHHSAKVLTAPQRRPKFSYTGDAHALKQRDRSHSLSGAHLLVERL